MAVLTLVEIAGNSDAIMLGMNDPFANPQAKSSSAISPPWLLAGNCSYALVYLMNSPDSSDPRLVLHLLASPKHGIESLAASATWALRSGAEAKAGELLRLINDNMDCERAFIDLFAKKNHAEKQARIQRTMSTESMVLANSTVAASNAPSQKARLHRGKVITLSDIEQFASSSTTEQPDTEEIDAEEVEQANKKLAKQLIITSLKERGVSRDHADFAALWSQIYRSLKFALRDQIAKRKYSVRELKAEANKHTAFYCSS
ncbi:hypothetical protein GGI25_002412 [Coemansia spiralis]|uniref:Sld7 C-terminal domain-containing protein n=2 Tax=Coemansia TaxID=4863 RepID=A0A9W8GAR2_9FUNG|nr:hypothetical protein EDC05_003503 [Coemansia umbellata]KAJ2619566.1 hypothetical protein GGI26_005727 [Coemansia sp. RSA 1358]KAJ2678427.1 hypothetical protein GGI25_002412 [Coemansia spiralis]